MNTNEFSEIEFDRRANSPSEWLFVADDLLVASHFLCQHSYHLHPTWGSIDDRFPSFDELRITPVILMLRAMATECLLKALYVKYCGSLSEIGRYKKIPKIKDHDLLALADKISKTHDLGIPDKERDFLNRLSRNLVRGRYPIHKTWKQEVLDHAGGDRRRIPGLMMPDYDDNLFATICRRLRTLLSEEAKRLYSDSIKLGFFD